MCVDHEPRKGTLSGKKEFVCGDNKTGVVRKKGKLGDLRKRGRRGQGERGRAAEEGRIEIEVHTKHAKMKSIPLYANLKKLIRMKKSVLEGGYFKGYSVFQMKLPQFLAHVSF